LISVLIAQFFTQLSLVNWVVIGGIVAVFGTIGDLVESLLKRSVGVKDSGSFMPGHGGFLDRFDAFIFCIPFVYGYLYF
jgi:phosphatidate cytidylyltransferase